MTRSALVIAGKEVVDSLRDYRSVISSLAYALMGPFVVGLVSIAIGSDSRVLPGMMSVFALVAAFSGGMNIAMDTLAGERERRSLLPLLLNPVTRHDVITGKWIAVSVFSLGGLAVNLLGFAAIARIRGPWAWNLVLVVLGIFPLALFAASIQLLISTVCRGIKEAQTYLSLLAFVPMGLGMFLVFLARGARGWYSILPIAGQQLQLEVLLKGGAVPLFEAVVLGCLSVAAALLVLAVAANELQRDEIVYGN